MSRLTIFFFSLLLALSLSAKTWYVDVQADPSVADGSAAHPFTVIQDAIDQAGANDTVSVAEGTYATGGGKKGSSGCASRVNIMNSSQKGLRLVGAGRGKSIIVGATSDSGDGFADTNYRCVTVWEASGVVISGFTLRGGGSLNENTTTAYNRLCGGGFFSYGSATDAYLVDCDIEDCVGRFGGGAYGGTLVRCRIVGCGATFRGAGAFGSVLVNSIIVRNRRLADSVAALSNAKLCNCTVADNYTSWATQTSVDSITNSIVVLSSSSLSTAERQQASSPVYASVLGTTARAGFLQLVAPAVGDYRPLSTSDAIGTADYRALADLSLPDGIDPLTDLSGAAIVADGNGKITAGAYQASVAPAGGALQFEGKIEMDGVVSCNGALTYAYAAVYPTQFCVRPVLAEGERLYRYLRKNMETGKSYQTVYPSVYPQYDGNAWMMPPPDPAHVSTNSTTVAKTVLWVDDDGSDSNDGTEDAPYKTLKKAAESCGSGLTLVLVKPGRYRDESMEDSQSRKFRLRVSTSNADCILFKAVEGPSVTFIEGATDADAADDDGAYAGCGPNAVRCVSLNGSGAAIQGFTLTGGHTDGTNAVDAARYGAAVCGGVSANRPQVLDCIISNNVAASYLAGSAIYSRCRFVDNYVETGIVDGGFTKSRLAATDGGVVSFCHFANNTIALKSSYAEGSVGGLGLVYNSTFVGTPKSSRLVSGTAEASFNCIYDGYNNTYSVSVLTNCLLYNYSSLNNNAHSYVTGNPLFADRGATSLLRPDSPAIGGGLQPTSENYGVYYWRFSGGDIDGNRIAFANGKPTVGASQTPVSTVFVTVASDSRGGFSMQPGTAGTSESVYAGKTITLTPNDAGTRLCLGMTVNGVYEVFTNASPAAVTLSYDRFASLADGTVVSVVPVYSTNLYVKAVGGDDNATGFAPDTAWQTLSVAAERLQSGETLWVLPGTYASGTSRQSDTVTIASRVVVRSGCRVISTEGAERTFIVGGSAGTDDYGCGATAVRGAYLFANALLKGFTITGGRTLNTGDGLNNDNGGGGVYGAGRDVGAIVDSCIVSNNVGRFGGGLASCAAVNSFVAENRATYRGSAFRQAAAYNCFVRGNIGVHTVDYCNEVMNCTVLSDNVGADGKSTTLLKEVGGDTPYLYNSLFQGYVSVPAKATVAHCAFGPGSVNASSHTGADVTIAASLDELAVDASGAPVIGVNFAAVDKGNASLLKDIAWTERDFGGKQRIMNGRMDIGCFEADWRTRYAADLGSRRRICVDTVSPEVVEDANGHVTIPSGLIALSLVSEGGKATEKSVRVRVTGDGSLTVWLNGEILRAGIVADDGEVTLRFENDLATNELAFEHAAGSGGAGCAEILKVAVETGLVLVFR